MKKRTFILNTIIILFMVFVAMILAFKMNKILEKKDSREIYYDFAHNSLNSDILFIGTSHVGRAINPIELWDMKGYTSYLLIAAGNGVKRDNAMLEMALDYTTPKLVVLDTDQYWLEDELNHQVKRYHVFSDLFPLSGTKIKTTLELYEDNSVRTELLFPWFIYHNRWKELKRKDFYPVDESKYLKGSVYDTNIGKANLSKEPLKKENMEELGGEDGLEEIEKFIRTCKENNIEVLLVTLPYSANTEQRLYGMKISEVASEYDVNYINFNEEEFFVDENIDFSDQSHMNVSGARKMTEFLGKYISENYEIPDRRADKEYADKWNGDRAVYYETVKQKIKEETELKKLLLMCNDKAFKISVYIDDTTQYQGADLVGRLLDDNPTVHIVDKDTAVSMIREDEKDLGEQKAAYVWVYDVATGNKICEKSFEAVGNFLTETSENDAEKEAE